MTSKSLKSFTLTANHLQHVLVNAKEEFEKEKIIFFTAEQGRLPCNLW